MLQKSIINFVGKDEYMIDPVSTKTLYGKNETIERKRKHDDILCNNLTIILTINIKCLYSLTLLSHVVC